jgi:error-prone DNA polymerase
VIVRPEVYERHRAAVRADPLLLAWGRLERHGSNLNVLATRLERIVPPADVPLPEEAPIERVRAAAPSGQHFGRGRR